MVDRLIGPIILSHVMDGQHYLKFRHNWTEACIQAGRDNFEQFLYKVINKFHYFFITFPESNLLVFFSSIDFLCHNSFVVEVCQISCENPVYISIHTLMQLLKWDKNVFSSHY